MTNFDKVALDIQTDGTVEPSYALKEASKVLVDHYTAIMADENFNLEVTEKYAPIPVETEREMFEEATGEEEAEEQIEGKTKIEDANFSQRTSNALLNAGIKTVAGLKRLSPLKLEEIKGLGKKGIDEIKVRLQQ